MGSKNLFGLKDTYGEAAVLESGQNLSVGSALTLRLADGREWQFLALGRKNKPGLFRVLGAEMGDSIQRIRH
jgi:hypothetical protein